MNTDQPILSYEELKKKYPPMRMTIHKDGTSTVEIIEGGIADEAEAFVDGLNQKLEGTVLACCGLGAKAGLAGEAEIPGVVKAEGDADAAAVPIGVHGGTMGEL